MEERIIRVTIAEKGFDVKSDTPDFTEIIEFIKDNDNLDLSNVNIECDDPKFDAETFKEAIVESISELSEKLRVNKECFDNAFKTLSLKDD